MGKCATFYVVRHAESTANVLFANGLGHKVPLTKLGAGLSKKGVEQANKISAEFRSIEFDTIYSSDYLRAHHTAQIIAQYKSTPILLTDLIRERKWNDLKGKARTMFWNEVAKKLKHMSAEEEFVYKPAVDIESHKEAGERLFNFIYNSYQKHLNKAILVVSHGNIMKAFLHYIGYANVKELSQGSIENTGYFILETDGKKFKILKTDGIRKQINY